MRDAQAAAEPRPPLELGRDLAARGGLGSVCSVVPLAGGANNRVFRVEASRGRALLKVYFRHPSDPRDRRAAEIAFVRFAWAHGVDAVPRPLAEDPAGNAALYEFIEGRRLDTVEVNAGAVAQAAAFFQAVNRWRHTPEAAGLPMASEACFSLEEHLGCVARRIQRLQTIAASSAVHREAAAFTRGRLAAAWGAMECRVRRQAGELGIRLAAPLSPDDRRLSPSDFGFHNALREAQGRLRFFDFEYAGWDDPAKLVCDFFCQPALPVPSACWDSFTTDVLAGHGAPNLQQRRAVLLLPVYRLKWCCIVLNEFLPIDRARRRFAQDGGLDVHRLGAQLDKARQALRTIEDTE